MTLVLGIVCLIQAGLALWWLLKLRAVIRGLEEDSTRWQRELSAAQVDRRLALAENAILNEFVEQSSPVQAAEVILRRLVPHEHQGLAVVLRLEDSVPRIVCSRGLSTLSLERMTDAEIWKDRVECHEPWKLEGASLSDDRLVARLTRGDRKKVARIFGLPLWRDSGSPAVLVTTSLSTPEIGEQRGAELFGSMLQHALANFDRIETVTAYSQRLATMRAMLELRSISDWKFDSPLQMMEGFLLRLSELVNVDRAALFLSSGKLLASSRSLVRCGIRLQAGAQRQWSAHEDTLARIPMEGDVPMGLSPAELKEVGVDSLVGSAVVVPLLQNGMRMGTLCLTRSGQAPFAESDLSLLSWAGGYLAETILRVLNSAHIERQAKQDGLTDLANRRTFDQRIEQELELARQRNTSCSLLLLDLDRFKSINDCYGHRTGDEVLKVAARIVQTHVATSHSAGRNLVARYGGEELAVVLPGMTPENAERLAQAIRRAIASTPIRFGNTELRVTVSGGVAAFPQHAETIEELIEAADSGLYQAKESGRNRICWAVAAADQSSVESETSSMGL